MTDPTLAMAHHYRMTARSPELAVSIITMTEKDETTWRINIVVGGIPVDGLGPYKEKITMADALALVATDIRLNKEKWSPYGV